MNEIIKVFADHIGDKGFQAGFHIGRTLDSGTTFTPFDQDGRKYAKPPAKYKPFAMSVSNGAARSLISRFMVSGFKSAHSARGALIWVLQEWCDKQGLQLTVTEQWADGKLAGHMAEVKFE